jgi:hypothetical protein
MAIRSGRLATTATVPSPAGGYAITQGTLAATANYHMTKFTPGVLTVTIPPNPDPSTLASSTVSAAGSGQPVPIRPAPSETEDRADGSRGLLADPRFDGTMICSGNANGAGCAPLASRRSP